MKGKEKQKFKYTTADYTRLLHHFLLENGIAFNNTNIAEYLVSKQAILKNQYRVALNFVCLNPPYWQYIKDAVEGARKFLLPGHQVDIFLWSDIGIVDDPILEAYIQDCPTQVDILNLQLEGQPTNHLVSRESLLQNREDVNKLGITIIPTAGVEWPHPTLKRYHLYLQQEEKLKEYDYIFHCDIDMRFVSLVGDEILGEGLTAVQMPMYAVDRKFVPPYEPNSASTAYIPRPGRVITEGGKPRFEPLYFAGGFQGGKAPHFLEAMKAMKANIDEDSRNGYIAIWNDESHWNKYLFNNPPSVVLDPGYTYPDSLIKEYFEPLWGRTYIPRLVTLTKKFTISKEGGEQVNKAINNMPRV